MRAEYLRALYVCMGLLIPAQVTATHVSVVAVTTIIFINFLLETLTFKLYLSGLTEALSSFTIFPDLLNNLSDGALI